MKNGIIFMAVVLFKAPIVHEENRYNVSELLG
jgi:hypothetical protein